MIFFFFFEKEEMVTLGYLCCHSIHCVYAHTFPDFFLKSFFSERAQGIVMCNKTVVLLFIELNFVFTDFSLAQACRLGKFFWLLHSIIGNTLCYFLPHFLALPFFHFFVFQKGNMLSQKDLFLLSNKALRVFTWFFRLNLSFFFFAFLLLTFRKCVTIEVGRSTSFCLFFKQFFWN